MKATNREISQAANRMVDILGLGRCAADRVVGAELLELLRNCIY